MSGWLVSLISLYRVHDLRLHFRGAHNLGIPKARIEEVILRLAHYSGWPTAVTANTVLTEV